MCDVEMCNFYCFLGAVLPNMWAEDMTAGSENNMCSRVVVSELDSPLAIDFSCDFHAYVIPLTRPLWQRPIQLMHNRLPNLLNINNLIFHTINLHNTSITLLPT